MRAQGEVVVHEEHLDAAPRTLSAKKKSILSPMVSE